MELTILDNETIDNIMDNTDDDFFVMVQGVVVDNSFNIKELKELRLFKIKDSFNNNLQKRLSKLLSTEEIIVDNIKADIGEIKNLIERGDREVETWFDTFCDFIDKYVDYAINEVEDLELSDTKKLSFLPKEIVVKDITKITDKEKELYELYLKYKERA